MDMKDFKYKSTFASSLTKISNTDLDKYLSLANLDALKALIPKGLDLENNLDLIGAALNSAVAGRMNLNGDSVSNETGVAMANSFLYKFVDSNHNRNRIIGSIVNTGFSEFGSNKIITAEEALKSKDPFNISLAIILYRLVLPDEFIELLLDAADPTSANYGRLSASWEILFNDYDIAVGSKNVAEAKVISDPEEKEKLEEYLQVNKGSGKKDGDNVYRVIKGDFIIGTGIGLVEHPAAPVKGLTLASINSDNKTVDTCKSKFEDSSTLSFSGFPDANKNNISHLNKEDVNSLDKSIDTNKTIMKISKITDITDESLKQAAASDMREFIESELKKESDKWTAEKNSKETAIKESTEKYESLAKEHETLKSTVSTLQAELKKFQDEKEAQAKQEKFTQRMASLDETYDLDNDDREVISKAVLALTTDESFVEYEKSLAKLLKHKNKAFKAAEAKKAEDAKKAAEEAEKNKTKPTQESLASQTAENALENATKDKVTVPNASEPGKQTLKEKYAKAFSEEGYEVVTRRKNK